MKKYLLVIVFTLFAMVSVANTVLAVSDIITISSVSKNYLSVSLNGTVTAKASLKPADDSVSVNWGDGSATTTGIAITPIDSKNGTWTYSGHLYPSSGTYTINAHYLDKNGTILTSIATTTTVVADTEPPVIDEHSDILNVEATGAGGAIVTFTVNSTDNVDGVLPAVCSPPSGSTFAIGTTTVDCNKTDSGGNIATTTDFLVNVVDTTGPVITLNPPAGTYVIPVFSTFTDPGATASDLVDGTVSVNSENDVNTSVLGSYTVTYSAIDSRGNGSTTTRPVSVVDSEDPIITLLGTSPVYVEVNTSYTDAGFTASDNVDGDLTASTTVVGLPVNLAVLGTTTITYNVTDSSGNNAVEQVREVVVRDTTAPIITILGDNPKNLKVGDIYTEAGATASDNYDGNITSSILTSGSVDTATAGIYTITYSVTDSSGNGATSTRTVNVRNLGTNSSLAELSVSQGFLSPAFDSGVKNYTVVLPYGTTLTPTAYATATDPYAWMIQINPAIDVTSATSSNRTTTVTVTAEDQISTSMYSVEFNVSTDTTPPVITILGGNPVKVYRGDVYTDAGATATDNIDGDVTSKIVSTSTVNTAVVGTYTVTYTVSDNGGNTASSTRTVNVERRSSGGGSSGGSSSSGSAAGASQTVAGSSQDAQDLANYLRFLNLLSVIGTQGQGDQPPAPVINAPTLPTAETIPVTQETPPVTEEVTSPNATEGANIPLSAAAATAGSLNINWWWVLVMIIIVGGLIYFYMKGRKNE